MMRVRNILAKRNLPELAGFASSNVLLAFDYDGTLAPIVQTPAHARMRPETRRLLTAVARRYPCVVISGRPLDDVTQKLDQIPVWYVFGDFGHEPASEGLKPPAQVRDWARQLTERLPSQAVTVMPRGGPDKGVALQNARRLFACDTAIYVGDDETDEDAFGSDGPGRLLSVRVGASRVSKARYCVKRQADVDTLLRTLLTFRPHLRQQAPPESARGRRA